LKKVIILALGFLAGCSVTAPVIEPIPGSLTYSTQQRTRLTRAPVGSSVPHEFRTTDGRLALETYVINPDRSLRLTRRTIIGEWPEL
jgi:hypothetical protein